MEEFNYYTQANGISLQNKENEEERSIDENEICQMCGDFSHPQVMLICDWCNEGWHMHYLNPKLTEVPEGNWYCPFCIETAENLVLRLEYIKKETERLDKEKQERDEVEERLFVLREKSYNKYQLEKNSHEEYVSFLREKLQIKKDKIKTE